jgi:CcmD family protein
MVIWTALFVYIMSLSRKNKELWEELQALQARVERLVAKRDAS